ncbi:MAG: hypothetical protein ACRCY9_17095 [Phycicoccus sp.]
MADVEIRRRGRRLERFASDVDPDDEIACTALLRRRALDLRRPVGELLLLTRNRRGRLVQYRS